MRKSGGFFFTPADLAPADPHTCAEPFDDPAWLFELKLDAESFGREMG
jgi:hypothetical protein